jgi:cytochrome P450
MNATAAAGRIEIDGRVFNPFDPGFIRDPEPTWQKLIAETPVAWHKDLSMWIVSTHALCDQMLKDNRFSPNYRLWEHAPPAKPEDQKNDFDRMTDHSLFMVMPEAHLRLRKLTLPAFARPVMAKIDAKIRDLVQACFDAIGDAEEFDVFSAIAEGLPARSIARMVGVPTADEKLFHKFSNSIVLASRINLSPKERDKAMQDSLEGLAYFRARIAERRAQPGGPGDDFLGSLIGARDGNDSLSDWDIISLISALITAGSDTAIDIHTYLIKGLLENPEQYALLKQKPELLENAIIELLRYGSMGKFPFFRFAAEDVEFGGQLIGKGQSILVNLSAAWHDPGKWSEPARLDITRRLDGNIVFGAGAHFCIGTYLVRVQASLMLKEFMRRFPDATLAGGDGELDYDYKHHNARRIKRLKVKTNLARQKAA